MLKIELDNETEPGYNIKPIVNTTGFILYSDEYIYIGFSKTNEGVKHLLGKEMTLEFLMMMLLVLTLIPMVMVEIIYLLHQIHMVLKLMLEF